MKIVPRLLAAGFALFFSIQQVIAADASSPSSFALLKDKKFKELDSFLQAKQHSYEAGNLVPDALYEQFNFASGNESWLETHLSAWIMSAPASYAAHVARGRYYVSRAWEARGDDYISNTPPKNIREMSRLMKLAVVDLEKSIPLTVKPLLSYSLLIDVGMAMGRSEQNRHWLDEANRIDPANTYVKIGYLLTLRPRWGGSIEEMQSFVDESKKLLKKQEDINLLQSHVWRSHAYVRWKDYKDYHGCIDYYSKAIDLHDKEIRPFARRGYCYHKLKKYDEALRDYNRVLSIAPRNGYVLKSRGALYSDLHRFDEAIVDLVRATEINPNDGYTWRTLGYVYYSTEKFDKAFASYQKGAEHGDADSQQSLGFLYRFGKGVKEDRDKAISWWKMAAKNGNAQAIHSLQLEGVLP